MNLLQLYNLLCIIKFKLFLQKEEREQINAYKTSG